MSNYNKFGHFGGSFKLLFELCKSITDCSHSTPKWTTKGKLVIRNFNIKKGRLLLNDLHFTDEKTYLERIKRSKPNSGDLIITREAPMGEVCMIPDDINCCLGQRMVLLKPNENKIDNKYLLYAIQSDFVQKQIQQSNKTGSIVSNLRIPVLENLLIPTFKQNIEKKIGQVLFNLDSKIELNNRINSELEQMAKTIYDYWFVQFDFPMSAEYAASVGQPELEGKPYKSSGGKMVWSEELKREVPEGWEVKPLGKVINIIRGASPRPIDDYLSSTGMPWVKISDATKSDSRFIIETNQCIILEGVTKSRSVFPNTLILSNSATPAIPRIMKINACVHDGWLVIDNYSVGLTPEFMYHYFDYERPRILSMGSGSIFKNLKTDYLKELKFILPPISVLKDITPQFQKINETIYIKTLENQKLTELRDWLLPMLMNGQVKVGDEVDEEMIGMAAEAVGEYKVNKK